MLYLAEVKKQSKGFIGGTDTRLKLLAFQRNDQSWTAVPGDEVITAEQAGNFSDGALLIVALSGTRQVQGTPQLAGTRIVAMLQNFSRLLDKSKGQEEEIEQWKQSLTYQSQELTRREMEMETRLEQLEQREEELRDIEKERQGVELAKIEVANIQQDCERQLEDLNSAWENLRGEEQKLEELKKELELSSVLDQEQVEQIQELISSLDCPIVSIDAFREELNKSLAAVHQQQSILDSHWQRLEQEQQQAQQQEAKITQDYEQLQVRSAQLQQEITDLEQIKLELAVEKQLLESKQNLSKILEANFKGQERLSEIITNLAMDAGDLQLDKKVDINFLENMPLGELESIVNDLQTELEKFASFVKAQEDELTLQNQEMQQLKVKIKESPELESIGLEAELTEAQDQYKILDESLIGSRRNLKERQEILKLHWKILRTRQGIIELDENAAKIDFQPVLKQIEQQQQQQTEEEEKISQEIEQLHSIIQELEDKLQVQSETKEVKKQEIEILEDNYHQERLNLAIMRSKLELYQEILQPWQDSLNQLQEKLPAFAQIIEQFALTQENQAQSLIDLEKTINSLANVPKI